MSEQKELTEQELTDFKKMVEDAKQKIANTPQDEIEQTIIDDDHCCAGESTEN